MSGLGGLEHIVKQVDGTHAAVWTVYKLYTAFQPIFAFNRNAKLSIAAYECLIRPFRDGNPVSPYQFFGSVPPEERFYVESLTRNLHLMNAGTLVPDSALVFANFDPSQFLTDGDIDCALQDMRLIFEKTGFQPTRFVCELTEQKSASPLALRNLITSLRNERFNIAVDDFGAEDSDFDRILEMKPDIVKFDAGWVIKLLRSASGYSLLKSMVTKVSNLGIKTLIEGAEEPWQLELIEKTGAMMVQGFGVARPQLASSIFPGGAAASVQASYATKPLQPSAAGNAGGLTFGRRKPAL